MENKIFKFDIIRPEKNIMENLNLSTEDKLYYIERMRLINDDPYHYTESYLPLHFYENLNIEDLIEI